MNFKKGDQVKVRSWESMEEEFGLDKEGDIQCPSTFVIDMKEYCGKIVTIEDVYENIGYSIEDGSWQWSDSMFETLGFLYSLGSVIQEIYRRFYD